MIKFIEKIFSGLAYQIGKFLFFVLLAISICYIVDKEQLFDILGFTNVDAATFPGWLRDVKMPVQGIYYENGNQIQPSVSTITGGEGSYNTFSYLTSNVKKEARVLAILTDTLRPGFYYSFSFYFCRGNYTVTNPTTTGFGATNGVNFSVNNANVYTVNRYTIDSNVLSYTTSNSSNNFAGGGYCQMFNYTFSVENNSTSLWFDIPETTTSSNFLNFYGYTSNSYLTYDDLLQSQNQTNEKLEDINENQQETNEKLNEINGTLTDSDTSENTGNDFFDTSSIVSSDGVVSSLLTLPIQMSSKLVDNLGGTCTPYRMNFGMLGKNYTLNFPCIDLENYFGSDLWDIIDLLFCGFMAYNIGMLFVSIYESITSLQDYYYSYIYQSSHEEHTRENRRARTPSE